MTPQAEYAAPGHKYLARLNSGIKWEPEVVQLMVQGEVTFEAEHNTDSPYEFWHELAFVEAFPEVTHWWFYSAWTQRVRLTKAQGMYQQSPPTVYGYMQFINEDQPSQIWTVTQRDVPVIDTPYPPKETKPVNLPLRLALARLVTGTLTDDVVPDRWMAVTSLVKREQLAQAFPTRIDALNWRLAGIETNIRRAFCDLQGLRDREEEDE